MPINSSGLFGVRGGYLPSGLAMWLDSTDLSTITLSEGNVVDQWSDKSGNERNATASGSARPTYVTNSLDGKPVIQFNGSSNFFSFDGTFLAETNYSIFAVERRSSGKSNNYYIGANDSITLNHNLFLGYRLNARSAFSQTSNGWDTPIASFSTAIPRVNSYRFSSSIGKNLHINGVSQTLSAVLGGTPDITANLLSNNNAQIGRNLTSSYYFGDIAEIIMYDRYLSDSEKSIVETYLMGKYNISA